MLMLLGVAEVCMAVVDRCPGKGAGIRICWPGAWREVDSLSLRAFFPRSGNIAFSPRVLGGRHAGPFIDEPCARLHVDLLRLSLILVSADVGVASATGMCVAGYALQREPRGWC